MLGLKSKRTMRSGGAASGPAGVETRAQSPTRQLMQPKRVLSISRQIACSFDDEAIQLAAVRWHGKQRTFLDVRKVYFMSDLESVEAKAHFTKTTIEEYVDAFGGRRARVSLVVAGQDTAFRTFMMPAISGRELASAVEFRAKKQIPFPVNDCEYDFRVVETRQDSKLKQARISVLAATRFLLAEKLHPFDELDIPVSRIYHAQDVIGQLLSELPGFDETAHYALINVKRNCTEIAYFHGSNLEFFHSCALGSSFLAQRKDPTVFEYFAESLAAEIQNSLDFYTGQFSVQFSNQVFIYGDLSYTNDMINMLSDRFGFRFCRFPAEELRFVRGKNLAFESSLPVCLPVVAAAACGVQLADLLPRDRKSRREIRQQRRRGLGSLAGLILILVFGWTQQHLALGRANDELRQLTVEVESFEKSATFNTFRAIKDQIASHQAYLEKSRGTPSFLELGLKELSHLTPEAVRLYDFEFHRNQPDNNLRIAGVVGNARIPPEIVLAEYIEKLSQSGFYDQVTLIRYSKRQVGRGFELDFEISARGVV